MRRPLRICDPSAMEKLLCDMLISAHPEHSNGDINLKQFSPESLTAIHTGTRPHLFFAPTASKIEEKRFSNFWDVRLERERKVAASRNTKN